MKKGLFEYLAKYHVDTHGGSWVLVSQVVEDMGISLKELWAIINEMKREAFLDHMSTNVPCADGLISVTITQRGRLWLKGEDYSYLPQAREKVYNLL